MVNRLAKASSSFGSLQKRVWQNHSLRLSAKLQVDRAVVATTLLYGSESWVLYRKQVQLLLASYVVSVIYRLLCLCAFRVPQYMLLVLHIDYWVFLRSECTV